MGQNGRTLTERARALLATDTTDEFRLSRTALEALVADSERYAALNARLSAALPYAQKLREARCIDIADGFAIRTTTNAVFAMVDAILGDRSAP